MKKTSLLFTASFSLIQAASAQPRVFKFQRLGMHGWTGAWSGDVVSVEGNKVSPRFTLLQGPIFARWTDYPAYAIQACKTGPEGFTPREIGCIESKGDNILVPEGSTPCQYSYKFKYIRNGVDIQESFVLADQTGPPEKRGTSGWN